MEGGSGGGRGVEGPTVERLECRKEECRSLADSPRSFIMHTEGLIGCSLCHLFIDGVGGTFFRCPRVEAGMEGEGYG